MEQGEIWWAEIPGGYGRRPVVVLTRSGVLDRLSNVTIAPLTRRVRGLPTEVLVGPDEGLVGACVISLDNVVTVEKQVIRERIGKLSAQKLHEVMQAIHYAFDMPF